MNRFLLFAGYYRNDLQGIFSLVGDYATLEGAKRSCDFGSKDCLYDWGHVFDMDTKRVIAVGNFSDGWQKENISIREICTR